MIINRDQGQSLKCAGLHLTKSVFTHGKLLVAFSRCRNQDLFFQGPIHVSNDQNMIGLQK